MLLLLLLMVLVVMTVVVVVVLLRQLGPCQFIDRAALAGKIAVPGKKKEKKGYYLAVTIRLVAPEGRREQRMIASRCQVAAGDGAAVLLIRAAAAGATAKASRGYLTFTQSSGWDASVDLKVPPAVLKHPLHQDGILKRFGPCTTAAALFS